MLNTIDFKKRILSFTIMVLVTISQFSYLSVFSVYAEAESAGSEKTVAVLAFTSDVHNKKKNISSRRLGSWMDRVKKKYGRIDAMCFCGDMASARGKKRYWSYAAKVMKVAEKKANTVLYTTGNHEYIHGDRVSMYRHDLNGCTKKFIEDDVGIDQSDYSIYCMGSSSYNTNKKINFYSVEQIDKLSSYLANTGNEKPIIIITHYPLHSYGTRIIRNADRLIDVLNAAAVGDPDDTADDKKIVFLWGHNHSKFDVNYDQIFEPGDPISLSEDYYKTIRFFYSAAGCMSDKEYSNGSASVKGKGLVITINNRHLLTFAYYDDKGINVTEEDTYKEPDPDDESSNLIVKPKPGILLPCMTSNGDSKLNISWSKVRGAEGYDVFFGEANSQMQLVQSLESNQWTATGLNRQTQYAAVVKAYFTENGEKNYIRISPEIYAYTSGGTEKSTNPETVTVKKAKVTLKPGKKYKIKAKVKKLEKRKKIIKTKAPKLRYISSNTSVAIVNNSGTITAMSNGNCIIYAYSVNGVNKAVTVVVK